MKYVWKWVANTNQLGHHVLEQEGAAEAAVPVVGDVSAVHDLPEQVAQVLPGHAGICFQIVEQHVHANRQVTEIEWVHSEILPVWVKD